MIRRRLFPHVSDARRPSRRAYEVTAKMDSRPLGGMTILSGEREQLFAAT